MDVIVWVGSHALHVPEELDFAAGSLPVAQELQDDGSALLEDHSLQVEEGSAVGEDHALQVPVLEESSGVAVQLDQVEGSAEDHSLHVDDGSSLLLAEDQSLQVFASEVGSALFEDHSLQVDVGSSLLLEVDHSDQVEADLASGVSVA